MQRSVKWLFEKYISVVLQFIKHFANINGSMISEI